MRFASTSDIPVKVLGAGTIKTASVRIEEGTAETAITPAADGQSIAITSTHCPKHANDDFKKWSCFTLTIDGATAETQIRWDTTGVGAESQGRPHLPGQHRDPQELTNELHNRRSAGSPCLPIVFRTIRS